MDVTYKALRKAVKAVEKEDAALPAVKGSRKMGVERKNKEASTTTLKKKLFALLEFRGFFKDYYMTLNEYINEPFGLRDTFYLWKIICWN